MCHCPKRVWLKTYPNEIKAGATKQWTIHANEADMPIKSDFTNDITFTVCNMIANIRIISFLKKMQYAINFKHLQRV